MVSLDPSLPLLGKSHEPKLLVRLTALMCCCDRCSIALFDFFLSANDEFPAGSLCARSYSDMLDM